MMAVRPQRRPGARNRDIGARDNAERTVKRHRQHAAQRGQRTPHVGVLHEISEVFVSGEAEAGGRAIDHGIHRVGKRAPPHRHRDDHEDLHDLFGRGDAEDRTQALRHPGVSRHREDRGERGARNAQQGNAGGPEYESEPYPRGRAGALVGGDDEPEHQQGRRNGGNADRCGESLEQQHGETLPRLRMAASSAVCKKAKRDSLSPSGPEIPGSRTRIFRAARGNAGQPLWPRPARLPAVQSGIGLRWPLRLPILPWTISNPASATSAKPAPARNVPCGPVMSQRLPAMTLAASIASPPSRLKNPKAVPRNSAGAVSATRAASNPCVSPMWRPQSTTPSATPPTDGSRANAMSAATSSSMPPASTTVRPRRSEIAPAG